MNKVILRSTSLYGLTINCYYLVIEANEKTVLVQEINKIVIHDDGEGEGKSLPDSDKIIGKPFRAYKRAAHGDTLYRSKHFINGFAKIWKGRIDQYNTVD